jgi:hypothetical protein
VADSDLQSKKQGSRPDLSPEGESHTTKWLMAMKPPEARPDPMSHCSSDASRHIAEGDPSNPESRNHISLIYIAISVLLSFGSRNTPPEVLCGSMCVCFQRTLERGVVRHIPARGYGSSMTKMCGQVISRHILTLRDTNRVWLANTQRYKVCMTHKVVTPRAISSL